MNKNKKIIIGSMLVLTMLLLMPSIPAIQQKIIEDRAYNDLIEQLDIKDIRKIKGLERIKHPFLYFMVNIIIGFRVLRAFVLFLISTEYDPIWRWPGPQIKYPLLWDRMIMLMATVELWVVFWAYVSCIMGWNWNLD